SRANAAGQHAFEVGLRRDGGLRDTDGAGIRSDGGLRDMNCLRFFLHDGLRHADEVGQCTGALASDTANESDAVPSTPSATPTEPAITWTTRCSIVTDSAAVGSTIDATRRDPATVVTPMDDAPTDPS